MESLFRSYQKRHDFSRLIAELSSTGFNFKPLKTVGRFVPAQHLIMVGSTQVEPLKKKKKTLTKAAALSILLQVNALFNHKHTSQEENSFLTGHQEMMLKYPPIR